MSFALYALLKDGVQPHSIDELMARVEAQFSRSKGFSARLESQPFSRDKSIRLDWGSWSADLHYTGGAAAAENIHEIAQRLGDAAPVAIQEVNRYIYAVFANDPDRQHTTQIVDLMQFLQDIDGAVVFDPKQNKLLSD
jgi:hypothetical protein